MARWFTLYLLPFIVALAVSVLAVPLIRRWAIKHGLVRGHRPGHPQDIHTQRQPVALWGGTAIFVSFFILLAYYALFTDQLLGGFLLPKYLWGILIAGIVLFIGGFIDDKYELPAKWQWVAPVVAILIIIASGVGIDFISNPLGQEIRLDQWSTMLFHIGDLPYRIVWGADLFTLVWMLGMIYAVKFIDGVDGLSATINFIGFLIIFFLCLMPAVNQPETAFLAVVMAGAILGVWIYQFPRGLIQIGEGGVWFMGFMLGLLAILSGGKIATALLVMGIPIIDTARVIIGRLVRGKSPFKGDNTHIHHLLLRLGLKPWQVVLAIGLPSLFFGVLGLILQGEQKVLALILVFVGMTIFVVTLGLILSHREKRRLDEAERS